MMLTRRDDLSASAVKEGRPLKRKDRVSAVSLRSRLLMTIVNCWVVPIVMIVVLAGLLLRVNSERNMKSLMETDAAYTMQMLRSKLDTAFEDSKAVSYDGVVRAAYRSWQQDGDNAVLYRSVNSYLAQSFGRQGNYKAVFISFWNGLDIYPYVMSSGISGYSLPRGYHRNQEPLILEDMATADTEIRLYCWDGDLYIARNLLDQRYKPYASVVQILDGPELFAPLGELPAAASMTIDGLVFDDGGLRENTQEEERRTGVYRFEDQVSGHRLVLELEAAPKSMWEDMPWLRSASLAVLLLVLPLLALMILLFRKHVTRPVEALVDATDRLQNGERGYQIEAEARSREFARIYRHFNNMSLELKNQFERSYLEQQALQQAKVKALQSQINPHFLNNTLEVINWEARLAGDERVSAMIEALSVMLNAALGRDGRSQIPLREELGYVDAYLYIIRERLGERLVIEREIDQSMMDTMVPRLILQPLVENAVEHDLTALRGGRLSLRAYREEGTVILECEHDGTMSEADLRSIEEMLSSAVRDTEISGQVGLRNVRQRLALLYGPAGSLEVCQAGEGRILARVTFPASG